MLNQVSRRRWLLSSMAVLSTATRLWAEEPEDWVAPSTERDWLPLRSRVRRLTQSSGKPTVITALAVDPRGQYVAVAGDDHRVRLLRTATLQTVGSLSGHRDLIRSLNFHPRGSLLASAGNDGQLILWNCDQDFRMQQRMSGTPSLSCVRFAPGGNELAAVGFGSAVYLIGQGQARQRTFQCDGADLRAVAYRDDGRMLAVAGRSGNLNLFDFDQDTHTQHPIHDGRIHAIAFHHQSTRLIGVAEDGCMSVFDTQTKELVQRASVTTGKLFAVAVLNSQLAAVAGSDDMIRIVSTEDGTTIRRLEGHEGSVSKLEAASGLLFSGGYDTTLRRWSIAEIESGGQRIAEGDPRLDR
jgi:WD40 repeat protein